MKARSILFALGALFAGHAFAASPFSIYFNTEGTNSCYVSNVTNVNVQPDGNIVATTSGTPTVFNPGQCGLSTTGAYTVGGSVSGQTGSLTLALTAGNQTVTAAAAATSYIFPNTVQTGTPYTVSVATPPAGQTCSVANASGTMGTAAVINANVTCIALGNGPYTIGGNVTGLTATGLVMAVTAGSQTKTVAAGATSYVFTTAVAGGSSYTVSVQTQPAGLNCSVANATGTANANVTNANVTCTAIGNLTTCTEGTAADVQGYAAKCSGSFTFHTGGGDTAKNGVAYSFKNIIGNGKNDWPGGPFGTSEYWFIGTTQYLSIPFTPSPGATITVNEAQSYTPHPISMSISTAPGKFNNGVVGNGVICVKSGGQPSLVLTSNNGNAQAQCFLDPNTQYWLNLLPAYYSGGQWKTDYSGSAELGITVYCQNSSVQITGCVLK